jgi:hypothetical protein
MPVPYKYRNTPMRLAGRPGLDTNVNAISGK